ncbi:6-phosphogluconolactonase [Croceivirga radicis]|uniref:6-phosphogluconolactonase n=2 Tax=Croceivirga radicis TaxID=1929488 RepID=A0A1V6LVR1_9FLAO|nr:6-phosphogluconolactonase [Croceivirga radicis]
MVALVLARNSYFRSPQTTLNMKMQYHILALVILLFTACKKEKPQEMQKIYIGTYTNGNSEGIYSIQFNPLTGTLDSLKLEAKLSSPSFLTLSDDGKMLYAVEETSDFDANSGGVVALQVTSDGLKEVNAKATGGANPCHVAYSPSGQLAVSNYSGGNLAIFDLLEDGQLGDRQVINHNPPDTTGISHVHMAHFNADGLFAADLGLDQVKRYTKQPYGWVPAEQEALTLDKGAGPRHFVFDESRNFMYVINELNATLTVFKRDALGKFQPLQTESTIDPNYAGPHPCADIHMSPDGQFLYGSNRGENTLVIFKIDKATGKISLVGRTSVEGDWPRNFTLSPDGKFVLVANKKSNNITVFKRDEKEGTLNFLHEVALDSPVCLVFE